MNWPNRLTVMRIFLVPVLIMFLLVRSIPNGFLFACIIFVIASITDHIDGTLARKYNQVTDFGRFADPLADKILVISTLICFIQLNIIDALPVIIVIFREFLVTSIRLVAASEGKVVAANKWGKVKTFSQILSIVIILIIVQLERTDLFIWCEVSVWISTFFSIISGIIYVKNNINLIRNAV